MYNTLKYVFSIDYMNINNIGEYIPEVKFKVEDIQKWNEHNFFFKDNNWNLLWYIRFNYVDQWTWPSIYVNETSSSYWFKHFPEYFRKLYEENWYNSNIKLKDFWKDMYIYVFNYILENYPKVKIINFCSLDKKENRESISRIIKRVQDESKDLIEKVLWWNNDWVCSTIFLNNWVKELTLKEILEKNK